ncbi:ABC transporter ATP-binding protein, partial [Candidatus Woesearchaeota archaeon]|nr:ABC transporter ATP-binding protein [Candidatus Woesearchaeota archaeon]
ERIVDVIMFNFAPMTFLFTVAILSMLSISKAPAIVIAVMVALFVGYALFIQRTQMPLNVYANKRDDIEKANMADYLTNIENIKYYGKEDAIKRRYLDLTERTKQAFLRNWELFRLMDAGHVAIVGGASISLIAVMYMELVAGRATIGDIAFVYTVFTMMLGPLWGFIHGIRSFARGMADFESVWEYDKFTNEIKDKANAKKFEIKRGAIEFKDVGFKYHKRKLFEGFSLKIKKNEKVALVGHSGSGKTTIVKLLYRLYDVNDGAILIDGKDIRDFKQESLRSELSIVPQEAVLFDDTIWNNIKFSRPEASDKEIRAAIRFAQLDSVIEDMPDKEKTIVGERGVKLSGGEKQRVSIARALLADKKVLVLDEATSALDSVTEHEIQQDLKKLMKGRTSIIIAHRLSTIMHADKIVVLEKGKIVQMGTHKELVRMKGPYKQLWNLQKGGFIK